MRRLLLLLGLATGLVACSSPTPEPTATATASPRPTNTATVTPSPTATATITPTPTNTATPAPTPTPQGYYQHPSAGFAFIRPSSWRVEEESSVGVNLQNEEDGLIFTAEGYPGDEEFVFADLMAGYKQGVASWMSSPQLSEPVTVTVASDVPATQMEITGKTKEGGVPITVRVINANTDGRIFLFVLVARTDVVEARGRTIRKVLDSLSFPRVIYGLDRGEAFVLLGGEPRDPEDLDPALGSGSAAGYKGMLFAGLVRLSPQLSLEPDLAESWEVSADGTVYTFKLRADAKFADGRPLTAEDVVYSWERVADPATESSGAVTYLGDIVGVQEKLDGKAETIAGLKVIDERTLEVTIDGPKAYFLAKLTYPTTFIVDQDNVADGDNWAFDANASGPYSIKEIKEEEAVIFERNPAYHTPAKTRYIVFLLNRPGSALSYYEAGDIDVVGLFGDDVIRIRREDDPLHAELSSVTSLCTTYLQIDVTRAPLDDVNVRRALALAIDKDAWIERLTQGTSLRADTVLPPAMPGFSADQPRYDFDAAAAREALKASQYAGNLPTITITTSGIGNDVGDGITTLIEMWRKNLGLTVKVEVLDPVKWEKAVRTERKGQIVFAGWCADYVDPENFLDALLYPGKDYNYTNYDNADLNALLEQARVEQDPAKRVALYQQAEKLILEAVAMIPLAHNVDDVLIKPRVQGYVNTPLGARIFDLISLEATEP
jgi:ABC-type transport system substrate-binding protein